MLDFKEARSALIKAIANWHAARPETRPESWPAIEDAITALDNEAYQRGYVQALVEAVECYHIATDRAEEIRCLTAELADARDYANRAQAEVRTAREEVARARDTIRAADARLDQTSRFRTESIKLLAALGRIEVLTRRGMNDDDLLTVVKRAQDEAWKAYRDAQVTVLPIGEDVSEEPGEEKGSPRLLRQIVSALVQREAKLEKALETLADRYHAQMCYHRRHSHSREGCPHAPLAVKDAEKALIGDLKFFETDDEQLNEAERQRSARVLQQMPVSEPEVEAVLMGNDIVCACGCYRMIQAGHTAYRFVRNTWPVAPLYVSKECARRRS